MNKGAVAFVVILSLFLALVGCNEEKSSKSDDEEVKEDENPNGESEVPDEDEEQAEMFNVEFREDIVISEDGNFIYIDVDTNLLDGTQVLYSVEHTDDADQTEGEILDLQNGEIVKEVDISEFDDGDINVLIGVVPNNQPDDISEVYGSDGEFLEGDYVFTEDSRSGLHFSIDLPKSSPVEISDSGDMATDTFTLASGFVVVDMDYVGDRNFTARLTDSSGNDSLVANWVGDYEGKTLTFVDGGEYYLEVGADGDWNATLTQTIPDDVSETPGTLEGFGYDVKFVEMTEGNKRFHFTHNGESNFTVRINDEILIANAVGDYEGSSAENIPTDNIYALNVQGDGDWTIEVEDY